MQLTNVGEGGVEVFQQLADHIDLFKEVALVHGLNVRILLCNPCHIGAVLHFV